jgi:hypothetical protein
MVIRAQAKDLADTHFALPKQNPLSSTKPATKSRRTNPTVTNGPPGPFKKIFKKMKKRLVTP